MREVDWWSGDSGCDPMSNQWEISPNNVYPQIMFIHMKQKLICSVAWSNIRILMSLIDSFRGKLFILENFLFEAPSPPHNPHTHKKTLAKATI